MLRSCWFELLHNFFARWFLLVLICFPCRVRCLCMTKCSGLMLHRKVCTIWSQNRSWKVRQLNYLWFYDSVVLFRVSSFASCHCLWNSLFLHLYVLSDFYSASALLAVQSAVLARGIPSVCPSITFRYCVQTNEDTILRFSPSGRTIPLVSGEVKFIRIFAGDHPERGR